MSLRRQGVERLVSSLKGRRALSGGGLQQGDGDLHLADLPSFPPLVPPGEYQTVEVTYLGKRRAELNGRDYHHAEVEADEADLLAPVHGERE